AALSALIDRCTPSDKAIECIRVAEKWKDKNSTDAGAWLKVAAHAARASAERDAVGSELAKHGKIVAPSPSPSPSKGKGSPTPTPAASPVDPLHWAAVDALQELMGEAAHADVTRKLLEWHADIGRTRGAPREEELQRFTRSMTPKTLKDDQDMALKVAQDL